MLYLIEDRDYLKIGYTKDINSRWKNYQLHNCYAKLISTKEGSRMDEIKLHDLCKDYSYKGEWYYNCEEVKNIFNTFEEFTQQEINHFKQIVTFRFINIASCYTIEPNVSDKMLEKIKYFVNNGDKFKLAKWLHFYTEQEKFKVNTMYINKLENDTPYEPQWKYEIFFNKNVMLNLEKPWFTNQKSYYKFCQKQKELIQEGLSKINAAKSLNDQNINGKYNDAIKLLLNEAQDIENKAKRLSHNFRSEARFKFIEDIIRLKELES